MSKVPGIKQFSTKSVERTPEEKASDAHLEHRYAAMSIYEGVIAVTNSDEEEYAVPRVPREKTPHGQTLVIDAANVHHVIDWAVQDYRYDDLILGAARRMKQPILLTGAISGTIAPTRLI